jgi:hypothetical protein
VSHPQTSDVSIHHTRRPTYRLRRAALAIFAFLAGVYLLTASGHNYVSDEEKLFGVTEGLARRGSFALLPDEPGGPPVYSPYGPAQSIAAIPLYLLARATAAFFPPPAYDWLARAIVGCFNAFTTASIGALLVLAVARLGYGRRAAIGTGLIYGLATMAWPHSKTFFSEPLTGLLLFGAFTAVLYAGQHPGMWLFSGLLAGLALAAKIQAGLALPVIGVYVLLVAMHESRTGASAPLWRSSFWGTARRASLFLLAWGFGAAGALALLGMYQWALFGSPLRSGYGGDIGSVLRNNMWRGAANLLWSSGKGILWYAPPLLLLPAGLLLLARRHWPVVLLCLGLLISHLLFYGRVLFWHGDAAWGPRYLNIVLPFLVLPLAALINRINLVAKPPLLRAALAACLLLAVPVQIGGLAINFATYINNSAQEERYHNPAYSPIVGHLAFAARQLHELYTIHVAPASIALLRGFSYSEGDRDRGEQTPRWTLPEAAVGVRPPAGQPVVVELGLSACRSHPLEPGSITLRAGAAAFPVGSPCPPRVYRLLLPSRGATLTITTGGWDPRAVGIARAAPLGVLLTRLEARAGGRSLAVHGALVPVSPVPSGYRPLIEWTSDYRYGHWDFWWWYLAHSGMPTMPGLVFGLAWLTLALGLIVWGAIGLAGGRGDEKTGRQDDRQYASRST